ncbi:MAG: SGNH/GDSL hydrolase family protein [Sphingobacteriia bacterium]|nr:MAG: SGNH/GDSL hydrolase family protein [Sphingobacteriia bacterium]
MNKCVVLFLLAFTSSKAQVSSNILIQRNGLSNFANKINQLHKNDTITIAFIGGSITQAEHGWRDHTFTWFKKQYPAIAFKQINAAIGGTGSDLGVYRLSEQVLKYKPDLLFVEFAVNDYDFSRTSILRSMEGIVRKTIIANSATDICFVYTITSDMYELYKKDSTPHTVKIMEEIADHYKIPSVNLGLNITRLVNTKQLFLTGNKPVLNDSIFFSADGVHPYPETGHLEYFKTLSVSLTKLLAPKKKLKHKLIKPFYSDALQYSSMIDITADMQKKPIELVRKYPSDLGNAFTDKMPNLLLLNDTAQEISFQFKGDRIGFMDVLAPSSAQITAYIDNDPPRYINRFDRFCFYFSRPHWFFIDGLTNSSHRIRIKISTNQPDKFLLLEKGKNKGDLKDIDDYNKFIWRVGKILVSQVASKHYKN